MAKPGWLSDKDKDDIRYEARKVVEIESANHGSKYFKISSGAGKEELVEWLADKVIKVQERRSQRARFPDPDIQGPKGPPNSPGHPSNKGHGQGGGPPG